MIRVCLQISSAPQAFHGLLDLLGMELKLADRALQSSLLVSVLPCRQLHALLEILLAVKSAQSPANC